MANLSIIRLKHLLSALAECCDRINSPEDTILDDAAIQKRVEDWCSEYLHDVAQDLRNAAALCEQNGLGGKAGSDADQMRSAADGLVCRWTDLLLHQLAGNSTPEQIAEWQVKYGAFPIPGPNELPETKADRWGALFGCISKLGERIRDLLQTVETDAIADAANAVYRSGEVSTATTPKRPGRRKADYETIQREAQLAADWEQARDAGTYKADFAKDNKLTVSTLDALLDRVAKRKRNSE